MTADSLSVLVIDENQIRTSVIKAGLLDAGYSHVTVVHDIQGVARKIDELSPDVIVIDLENPNRDMLEAMFSLSRSVKRPIAMFVDHSDQWSIEAAVDAGVSAYIVDGLRQERVKPIMDMAISRFRAYSKMETELAKVQNELAERKSVNRAKEILIKSKGIDEEQAYALLRKTAMNKSLKIHEVAESIIMTASLLDE